LSKALLKRRNKQALRVVMSEGLQEVAKATAYEWRRTMT